MIYLLHSGIIDKLTSDNEAEIKVKLKDEKNEIIIFDENYKIIGIEFIETIFNY
jgi:hypothetical protein